MDYSPPQKFPGENTGVGCHFLPWGNLPDPGMETLSLVSPALAGGFFTSSTPWEAPKLDKAGNAILTAEKRLNCGLPHSSPSASHILSCSLHELKNTTILMISTGLWPQL